MTTPGIRAANDRAGGHPIRRKICQKGTTMMNAASEKIIHSAAPMLLMKAMVCI